MGNNFIRKYYSIFDRGDESNLIALISSLFSDNMQVGFMRANHEAVIPEMKIEEQEGGQTEADVEQPLSGSLEHSVVLISVGIVSASLF